MGLVLRDCKAPPCEADVAPIWGSGSRLLWSAQPPRTAPTQRRQRMCLSPEWGFEKSRLQAAEMPRRKMQLKQRCALWYSFSL